MLMEMTNTFEAGGFLTVDANGRMGIAAGLDKPITRADLLECFVYLLVLAACLLVAFFLVIGLCGLFKKFRKSLKETNVS